MMSFLGSIYKYFYILRDFIWSRWLVVSFLYLTFLGLVGGHVGSDFGVYLLFRDPNYNPAIKNPGYFNFGAPSLTAHFYSVLAMGLLYCFHLQDRMWKVRTYGWGNMRRRYQDISFLRLLYNFIPLAVTPALLSCVFYAGNIPAPGYTFVESAALGCILSTLVVMLIVWGISHFETSPGVWLKESRLACPENLLLVIMLLIALIGLDIPTTANALLYLLLTVVFIHMSFGVIRKTFKPLLVVCILSLLVFGQRVTYKYHVPGMVSENGSNAVDYYNAPQPLKAAHPPSEPLKLHSVSQDSRRKLIVISASGGGYRSAFWTATVLDYLRKREIDGDLTGFSGSVGFVSGASGGAVALGYYVVSALDNHQKFVVEQMLSDLSSYNLNDIRNPVTLGKLWIDSLSPVARQMVKRDLFHLFMPVFRRRDRGIVLQEEWKTLEGIVFKDLANAEQGGKVPTIILSPVLIETGSPLLITNLKSAYFGDNGGYGTYHFFEIFPGIEGRFKLSTAVRLAASFPIISPAVDLPTTPPVRIADAGFFDNQSSYWLGRLLQNSASSIIEAYDGVIWIEINAFGDYKNEDFPDCNQRHNSESGLLSKFAAPWKWLTAPFEALLNVREAGMPLRSEADFLSLAGRLRVEAQAMKRLAFTTERFVFTNSSDASLSWVLRGKDIDCMQKELLGSTNQMMAAKLVKVWNK
jgi:hypothetical protein